MPFENTEFGLRSAPLTLQQELDKTPARVIGDLNKWVLVPSFTAPALGWPGASYIVAQAVVNYGSVWAIETPFNPPPDFSFVAAVAYSDPVTGVWTRRKLWRDVGEVLNYPVYTGENLPASGVHLEIWTVRNYTEGAVLEEDWYIPVTELELPETFDATQASTGIEIAEMCLTHASEEPSDDLEEALGICEL